MTTTIDLPELTDLQNKSDEDLISIFGLDKPLKGIKASLVKLNALPEKKREKAAKLFMEKFKPEMNEWQLDDILYEVKGKNRSAVEVMNDEDFE